MAKKKQQPKAKGKKFARPSRSRRRVASNEGPPPEKVDPETGEVTDAPAEAPDPPAEPPAEDAPAQEGVPE